jgi:hypothetical protein
MPIAPLVRWVPRRINARPNLRIDMYQRTSASSGTGYQATPARDFRYLMNFEEQDRRILEGLIDRLQGVQRR